MSGTGWRIALLAGALSLSPITQAQQAFRPLSVDLAVTYTAERAKVASTSPGPLNVPSGVLFVSTTIARTRKPRQRYGRP